MLILALLILVALAFDFMNGFHDAANSIATVVSTRVLTPRAAVAWAAFFNFVAAFGFGVAVATTIGKGVVNPEVMDRPLIFAGLAAAFTWDWITWRWGLPTSSSHALIGAFAGAALTKAGPSVLVWSGITRIVIFIVVSPFVGLLLGAVFMFLMMSLLRDAHRLRGSHVPAPPARLRGGLQPRARHQRRAEDDGDHRRPALHLGL